MSGRIIFLRRVQLAGGVPHTTFLGLRSAMKKPEDQAPQKLLDQRSFDRHYPDNIPFAVCKRIGVAQCEDE